MMKTTTRICIYPKDVQRITGKSYSASCKLIKKIKKNLRKKEHQFVTVEEFSRYMGFPEDKLYGFVE